MQDSTKDQVQGAVNRIKGKSIEYFGKAGKDAELEAKGKDENRTGKIQQKVGEIEKVFGQ